VSLPVLEPCYGARQPRTNFWHIVNVSRSPRPPYTTLCERELRNVPLGELRHEVDAPRCDICVAVYRQQIGGPAA